MRHCDDAEAAQEVISGIEAGARRARLRPRRRGHPARRPRRLRRGRNARELAARRAGVQVRRRGEDDACSPTCSGTSARRARSRRSRALEPVFVGGTTVTRATLANQEVIRARGIKIGDTVLVRRAGDVIPFVAGVLDASKRTGEEQDIVPPSECPSCGEPLTEQGNSRELFCTNVACPAQTVRRLIHWASRAAADIEAVGPVWIERLAEAGDLENPSDFYALTRERLLEFDRIGEVSRRSHDRVDRRVQERRPAPRADRPRRSRWPPRAPPRGCAARASSRSRRSPTRARRRCRPSRTSARRSPRRWRSTSTAPAAGARAAARARRVARRARRGPPARGRLRRAAGRQDRRHHRHDLRPAQRREGPAPDVPAPVREGRRDHRLLGLREHRHADLRRRRRRRKRPRPRSSRSRSSTRR